MVRERLERVAGPRWGFKRTWDALKLWPVQMGQQRWTAGGGV